MKISNEFKIGFWAIVALVTLFLGINYLKGINTLKQGQFYTLMCDKVDGLAVSSHIKLHGLKIGMVRSMEYDPELDRVKVALNIYDSDMRIPVDSRFFIQTELLGTADVVIEMGSSTTCYEPGATIIAPPTSPSLLEKADPIVEQITQLMPKIDTLVSGINVLVNESKLHESLLEVNTMTTHLNQTVNELNRLLRKEVPGLMAHVNSAAANVDTLAVQLKEAEINTLLNNANQTVLQVNQLLQKVQSDQSTAGQLLNSTQLHDQLNRTVADIDSLVNDIKQNPKRYIHIKVF